MYRKAWCTCKVVVLLIKPIVFLTFSLPSMSLDLKVPDVKVKQSSIVSQIVSSPDVLSWLVLLDPVNESFVRCR